MNGALLRESTGQAINGVGFWNQFLAPVSFPLSFDEAIEALRRENASLVRVVDCCLLHNLKTVIIIGLALTEA